MPFNNILKNAKRCLWEIRKHKNVFLCILLTLIFITAVSAVVYNYMSIQSSVGVSG